MAKIDPGNPGPNSPEAFSRKRIEFQKQALDKEIWQSCINCEYWGTMTKKCGKFDVVPPYEVIVVGCEHWLNDIPF